MNDSSNDHPDENLIAGYLDDDLDATERAAVETHLEQCASCRHAVAEAARVLSSSDKTNVLHTQRSSRRSISWLAGTAALAASVVAVMLLRPAAPRDQATAIEREANAPVSEGMRILREYTPANGVRLQTAPSVFQWASTEQVDRYRFVLLGADAVTIWSTETPDTALTLPRDVVARLASGATYLWHVDAIRGGREATTRLRSFSIAP